MQCVYHDDRLPNGFEELFFYSAEIPYTICIKKFQTEDIVPLHYAQTMEILLCEDLCGEIVIENRRYGLEGTQAFVIPPYTVHSNMVRPCKGTMFAFKISFQEMNRYFNVRNYLAIKDLTLGQLQYLCPEYEAVRGIVGVLMEKDGDLMACLEHIVALFGILSAYADRQRNASAVHFHFKSSSLQELIRWTSENFARKITIDEVAKLAGYSKYHFCAQFKAQTGMTYMKYLNSVRVFYACLMLRSGESVQTVGSSCGFENTSHFIQAFKKVQHMTPRQYAIRQKKLPVHASASADIP